MCGISACAVPVQISFGHTSGVAILNPKPFCVLKFSQIIRAEDFSDLYVSAVEFLVRVLRCREKTPGRFSIGCWLLARRPRSIHVLRVRRNLGKA